MAQPQGLSYPAKTLKAGFLVKQGQVKKNWKKRWFVLTDKNLFYYKTSDAPKPLGAIPLDGCHLESEPQKANGWKICHPNRRIFHLTAATPSCFTTCDSQTHFKPEEMDDWLYEFEQIGVHFQLRRRDRGTAALKEGWGHKEGLKTRNWKRRWFVLRPNVLLYYEKRELSLEGKEPLGSIILFDCNIKPATEADCGKEFGVAIFHPQRRTYYLHFSSEEERQSWCAALQAAKESQADKNFGSKAGHLKKKGKSGLESNYCILRENVFYFAESSAHYLISGAIDLESYSIANTFEKQGELFPFSLCHPQRPILILYASSDQEREQWIQEMQQTITALTPQQPDKEEQPTPKPQPKPLSPRKKPEGDVASPSLVQLMTTINPYVKESVETVSEEAPPAKPLPHLPPSTEHEPRKGVPGTKRKSARSKPPSRALHDRPDYDDGGDDDDDDEDDSYDETGDEEDFDFDSDEDDESGIVGLQKKYAALSMEPPVTEPRPTRPSSSAPCRPPIETAEQSLQTEPPCHPTQSPRSMPATQPARPTSPISSPPQQPPAAVLSTSSKPKAPPRPVKPPTHPPVKPPAVPPTNPLASPQAPAQPHVQPHAKFTRPERPPRQPPQSVPTPKAGAVYSPPPRPSAPAPPPKLPAAKPKIKAPPSFAAADSSVSAPVKEPEGTSSQQPHGVDSSPPAANRATSMLLFLNPADQSVDSISRNLARATMKFVALEETVYSGYLSKKGGKRHNWRTRFFVLKPRCLAYYTSPNDLDPLGILWIKSCTLGSSTKKPFCFALNKPGRTYYLACKDANEKQQWMSVLQKCILNAQSLQGPVVEQPMIESVDDTVMHEGFLWKKGAQRRNWTTRWFVLKKGSLSYAKSVTEKPIGVIALSHATTVVDSEVKFYSFAIVTANRTYYLAAKSTEEKSEWMKLIQQACILTS